MKLTLRAAEPLGHSCLALVAGCFEDDPDAPFLKGFDKALGGELVPLLTARPFAGKLNRTLMVHALGRIAPGRLLLVGLGKRRELTPDRLRQAAGSAIKAVRGAGLTGFSSILHQAAGSGTEWLQAEAEGFLLGGYTFNRYKAPDDLPGEIEEVVLLTGKGTAAKAARESVARVEAVCESALLARDLVGHPGNVATPAFLGERAVELAGRFGFDCTVLERDELERLGMEALLAVAKGSCQPPRLIVMEYRGADDKERPTVLVGKGITFDSGGISLKPREGMEKMKDDMAGGAAVIATVTAAARLRLPVNLVGLVAAAENLPGGRAYKPGDVIRAMAGKTIEIVNTDAEGRLVLCDALHYAQRYKPAALIDLATLTGACVVALGSFATGLMGNDERLAKRLKVAGERCGERLWELPLWDEYGELMKSDIADLKNAGGPEAGSISAGWFLKQFAGKTKWVHLDIAGTAWTDKERPYLPKGATGVGVRLLIEYLQGEKER